MLLKKKSRKSEIPLVTCIRGRLSHAKNTNHLRNTNTVFVEASLRREDISLDFSQGQNDCSFIPNSGHYIANDICQDCQMADRGTEQRHF